MSNKVIPTPFFERKFRKLSKKYPAIGLEILELERILLKTPDYGESLGANIF
jgi:hypothetical protein